MKHLGKTRAVVALGAIAIIVGACGGTAATAAPAEPRPRPPPRPRPQPRLPAATEAPSAEAKMWKIGYSNAGGVGNGFREEQVCTAKAEALASGQVSELTVIHQQHGCRRPAPGHP